MTTFTLVMVAALFMPNLMVAGLLAALLPLAVLLLIRRRSKQLSWGAMWLVQETLRKHAPLKVLRVILFLIRTIVLPLAALALVGLWFNPTGVPENQSRVIILDDAIGAWETGSDGQCAMDVQLEVIEHMQSQTNKTTHVVLLSGRSLPSSDVFDLRSLTPISSGPDWTVTAQKVNQLVDKHNINQVVLLSDLRSGVLHSFSGEFIPGVTNSFIPPNEVVRSTIRVTGVQTPRDVLLPGDPFQQGQLTIDIARSNAASSEQTKVLLDVLGPDNTSTVAQYTAVLIWGPGEYNRRLSMMVPEDLPTNGLIHVHIDESTSPAAQWWVRIRRPEFAQVTMITSETKHPFDPALATSWLSAGIQAGAHKDDLTLQWLDHINLQVDAIVPNMPVVVTEPALLTPSTWEALHNRPNAGPTLIIPPIDAASSWLDNAMQSIDGFASINGLTVFQPSKSTTNIIVADKAGALELISNELEPLLRSVNIERMVDLQPLTQVGIAHAIVSIGEHPIFVQVHNTNIIISALAWHPSWSDISIRSAAPTILQEALRSKGGRTQTDYIIASSPNNTMAGPQADGVLVQPDTVAANQSLANQNTMKRLEEAGWIPHDVDSITGTTTPQSSTIAMIVFMLLGIEVMLAHIIDRHRRTHHVTNRTVVL